MEISSPLQERHNERDGVSIISLKFVYSTIYSGADQGKHQSSASLAFVREIHQWPMNYPHKGQVARKMFPFDDVIMLMQLCLYWLAVVLYFYNLVDRYTLEW